VTVVIVTYIRVLTFYRSRAHMLYCVAGRVYVVKPWEKANAHGLEFYVMV
jgi:hypothetical protein